MSYPWLTTLLILLPVIGAAIMVAIKPRPARNFGLLVALATLVLGVVVTALYWQGADLNVLLPWLPALGSSYNLSVDGLGLAMVLLTVVLTPLVLIAEWLTGAKLPADASGPDADSARPDVAPARPDLDPGRSRSGAGAQWTGKSYSALTLLVEAFALAVFLAGDVLVFYIFFEASLIPMYFLIAGFGSDQVKSRQAALKFLLFGLAGGLVMLFAVVGTGMLAAESGNGVSFNIATLAVAGIGGSDLAKVVFVAYFVAFALKAPMVPGHTWLPQAAEQATPGSAALMVGVLDKLGTFGMIRLCVELFPDEARWATPVIMVLALISIIYGALAAIGQKNLLRLVAFTSISHFGFMVIGVFALTSQAMTGSIFYMVNHGLSTGALFLLVGYLVRRRGSAVITDFGGVMQLAPVAAGFTLLAGLAGCALPGTSSFVSEFLVMAGAWPYFPVVAAVAALGTVLAALYILRAYQRIFTGQPGDPVRQRFTDDLNWRERLAVIPLLVAILGLGFFPQPAINLIEPTSQVIVEHAGGEPLEPVLEGGR